MSRRPHLLRLSRAASLRALVIASLGVACSVASVACTAPGTSGSCADFPTAPACLGPEVDPQADTVGGGGGGGTQVPEPDATAATTPGPDTSGPTIVCPSGTRTCDVGCVYDRIDANNCGACGKVCAPTVDGPASCVDGVCAPRCPAGRRECDGHCVDTDTDPNACGACGKVCPTADGGNASCVDGRCEDPCMLWEQACDVGGVTTCVGKYDPMNCGQCGRVCAAPVGGWAECPGGTCGGGCPEGQAVCDGVCIDIASDLNNCGGCGQTCDAFVASHGLSNAVAENPTFACIAGHCSGKFASTTPQTCGELCASRGLACVAPSAEAAANWWQECPAEAQDAAGAYWNSDYENTDGGCKVYGSGGASVAYAQGCDAFAPTMSKWWLPFFSTKEVELHFYAMWCTCQ